MLYPWKSTPLKGIGPEFRDLIEGGLVYLNEPSSLTARTGKMTGTRTMLSGDMSVGSDRK